MHKYYNKVGRKELRSRLPGSLISNITPCLNSCKSRCHKGNDSFHYGAKEIGDGVIHGVDCVTLRNRQFGQFGHANKRANRA